MGQQAFGEMDGRAKYLDEGFRGERSLEQVLLEEKNREDEIRGITGHREIRWGYGDLASLRAFGEKLVRFGIEGRALR
ncbi:hypothetical protein [Leucobacter sp. USHLN153]|uniref:hypothetical protein n=1 Tax=Leucobacter sp. USHLN153 TaxID=3081268 RepID=UPI0030178C58